MNTDLIIIGSGPGGYHTAGYAAKNGLSVVIIEEADCIETVAEYTGWHPAVDFARIAERKRSVVELLRGGVEALMATLGITFAKTVVLYAGWCKATHKVHYL